MTDEQFDKLCDFLEELVGENWNAFYNAKDDKLTICFHHEEKPLYKWRPLSLKTLNGDDIVAYESSCCKAIADKKYQHCPKCNEKMDKAKAEVLASVERPKDEWHYYINSNVNGYMHDGCECREEVFPYCYNFCPNCGADMRGGIE